MFHPLVMELGKLKVRRSLRKQGKSPFEINDALDGVSQELVEAALPAGTVIPTFGEAPPAGTPPGAFGDGHIIKAVEDFFATPLGQLILKIIEAAALSFFGL